MMKNSVRFTMAAIFTLNSLSSLAAAPVVELAPLKVNGSVVPNVELSAPTSGLLEAPAVELSIEERRLDGATLDRDLARSENRTVIRLSEDKVFEFENIPDKEAMKKSLGLKLPEKVKAQILARGGSVEEVDPMLPYENLPEERKLKFQEMRLMFLTNAARILNTTKFVFGAGSLVGDAFTFVKINAIKAVGKEVEAKESVRRTFNQRSHETLQAVLRGIDYKLWSQAPLVIDSNEYGLSLTAGIVAETGILRRGAGGAEEVGVSIAFNKNSRAFVFEIFHNSEKFDNTKAAISVLGVVAKAGMTLARRDGAATLKGSSFYPPAVPGYTTSSPEFFSAGLSSSLGLPPPPLADLLTFTNTFERNSLIRITVSPIVKGFVRIQIGDVKGSMTLVAMRFVDVYSAITDKVFKARRSCGVVFN